MTIVRSATGPEYLRLATTLLQQMRLASPEGGVWEAADIQWWSRKDQRTGLFWLDAAGEPLAAFLSTGFNDVVQCDVLVLPHDKSFAGEIWQAAIGRVNDGEFTVRLDDQTGIAALAAAGYTLTDPKGVVACWLDAADRPPVAQHRLAPGYRLVSRAEDPDRPYPLIARNGPDVEQRLRECSLYRPDLDLTVVAPDGEAAAYGLFWADPVTSVGLVEPIRTMAGHEGHGLASHLVATGLDLLAANGCRRLKVDNDRGLYTRLGFRRLDSATAGIYRFREFDEVELAAGCGADIVLSR
jgi:GNAT superfamily N-acetyltransferase